MWFNLGFGNGEVSTCPGQTDCNVGQTERTRFAFCLSARGKYIPSDSEEWIEKGSGESWGRDPLAFQPRALTPGPQKLNHTHTPSPLAYPRTMADKDPITVLGERSQRRGTGNFREAYTVTENRCGEQAWSMTICDKESGRVGASAVSPSKKKATKEAAVLLLKALGEGDAAVDARGEAVVAGDSLNDDALAGDKVLGLCLVLWLREHGTTDRGVITRHIANKLSNEALQRNAHKVGVEVSGYQTHRDGSLVEQHAWKVFAANNYGLLRTMDELSPLFGG